MKMAGTSVYIEKETSWIWRRISNLYMAMLVEGIGKDAAPPRPSCHPVFDEFRKESLSKWIWIYLIY